MSEAPVPGAAMAAAPERTRQRLVVGIDHVATLRRARGGGHPDPILAAGECAAAGADGIAAHLRADRRHVQDDDVERLATAPPAPLHLQVACTPEMVVFALKLRPHAVTFVAEHPGEITTTTGLDLERDRAAVGTAVRHLRAAGVRVALLVDPTVDAVDRAASLAPDGIELLAGPSLGVASDPAPLDALRTVARRGAELGLEVHAGVGLGIGNIAEVARIPAVETLYVGHAIMGRALFVGLAAAVREVRALMDAARAG